MNRKQNYKSNLAPKPNSQKTSNQTNLTSKQPQTSLIKPEQVSLLAHQHIHKYLEQSGKTTLDQNDLNAILRLSQHLRIFGLVSAVGYLNQSNAQENNETRKRTVPVWECLLGQLIDEQKLLSKRELMEKVITTAKEEPSKYISIWRKALNLTTHWNFWGRAYLEEKCTQDQN